MKADSGYLFVLQDSLNTCMYAAHGGTINLWDSGSRFAVAGQNKVYLPDGRTPAPGFKSIHFGSPNEYAFEYLMSGAAAGRVFVLDPTMRLDPAQYRGNVLSGITPEEWSKELAPFIEREARRRGAPVRIEREHLWVRLEDEWHRWRYDEAFAKLIPVKVAKASQEQGVVARAVAQIVGE